MQSATAQPSNWNFETMLKTSGISREVQLHLAHVYAILSLCVVSAAASVALVLALGSAVDWTGTLALVSFAGTIGGTIWLQKEPKENFQRRLAILAGVSASTGISLAALVEVAIDVDPSILVSAFMLTTTAFLCFTGSALLAKRRAYLFLGGMLSSAVSMMMMASLFNVFFQSSIVHSAHLYGGLLVFCGYIVFDTQMIIEKASMGDLDPLRHALELFLDFVAVFVRVLVILLKNSEKKTNESNKRRR